MRLQSSAVAAGEDTGVGHDPMVGVSLPPGFHTATPVVSPIPTSSGDMVHFAGPPLIANTPEQASTSNATMMPLLLMYNR